LGEQKQTDFPLFYLTTLFTIICKIKNKKISYLTN